MNDESSRHGDYGHCCDESCAIWRPALCRCGHDLAQHSKGLGLSDYCRHCPCGAWYPPAEPPDVP